jgi:CxxC-x17-CxxC domain-containing protein
MSFQDKALTCVECGNEFAFTANEQAFYADRGFTNEPKRCPNCRQSRKASRGGSGYSSGGGYESGGGYGSSGGGSYGGGQRNGGGGGYGGGQREMHVTTCSSCGGEARVPFVPRGDKPVLCSDCFSQQRGGYSRPAGRY